VSGRHGATLFPVLLHRSDSATVAYTTNTSRKSDDDDDDHNNHNNDLIILTSCYSTGGERPHRCCPLRITLNIGLSDCAHAWICPSMSAQKVPLPVGDPGPHLKHGSLAPPESRTLTLRRSIHPLLQGSPLYPSDTHRDRQTDRQTDKQTDHATCAVAVCCILVLRTRCATNNSQQTVSNLSASEVTIL